MKFYAFYVTEKFHQIDFIEPKKYFFFDIKKNLIFFRIQKNISKIFGIILIRIIASYIFRVQIIAWKIISLNLRQIPNFFKGFTKENSTSDLPSNEKFLMQ